MKPNWMMSGMARAAVSACAGGVAGALLLAGPLVQAQQTVAVRAQPVRVTVADVSTNSHTITNYVDIGNYANPVFLSFSSLPAGAGGSLDMTTFTDDGGANFTLATTNIAQGEHVVELNATGGASNVFLLTLQSGRMWTGGTNIAGQWSAPASWVGGQAPGPSDDVLFTHLGAQTNNADGFTNSIVDADIEIASLRFSQSNNTARYHTLAIGPGRTLSITGSRGLALLRDETGVGAELDVYFRGEQGSLVVSNAEANIALAIDNQQRHRFDLSGLGTFEADVQRIGLGDYTLFPQYSNLVANGFGGDMPFRRPRRFTPTVRLARTNVIHAAYVDPSDFADNAARRYGLEMGNNEVAGTSQACTLELGIRNEFYLDSICFAHFGSQGRVGFNPAFAATNPIAYFRGAGGGRMSMFCIGDAGGPGYAGSNTKMTADFGGNNGEIDAQVDRLYISRDRALGTDYNTDCTLVIGRGVFDVNTAIVGFQENPGQTNRAYTRGLIVVSNAAIFRVNDSIELGYTTEDPANTVAQPQNNRGTLRVADGGTVLANTIRVGGVTKASSDNTITITNGSTLVLSNTLAGADAKLRTLSMYQGSTLALHVDCLRTEPYVYATNLVTGGALNTLRIASIANLSSVDVPLIVFDTGSPIFGPPAMPAGLNGALLTSNNVIYLSINTNAPKHLAWRGYVNGDWDLATANWLDLDTMLPATFSTGDHVILDDTAGVPTTIHLSPAATLIPGKVTMTNTAFAYTIGGAGTLQGSATFAKWGANTLAIETVTTLSIQVNEGSLIGSAAGAMGSAAVAEGATMNFAGNIASGMTVGGIAACSGTIGGTVVLESPSGTLTNLGTGSASLTFEEGTLLYNAGSFDILGSGLVGTSATLVNAGTLSADRLTVMGTLKDMGIGSIVLHAAALGTLTIGSGGTFIPGGDAIGTTTVTSDGSCSGSSCFPGRLVFAPGSTNVFRVDLAATPAHTFLRSGYQDFGPSQSMPSFSGGTLHILNVGAAPFSAGQSFKMFGNDLNDGDLFPTGAATNSYPVMEPAAPGPGLAWDLRQLRPQGIVGIISVPSTGTDLGCSVSFLTTISTNVPPVTNYFTLTRISWPDEYTGWRLEQQQNPLNIGLSTNWATVFESVWTNTVTITNAISTNGNAGFFRLVYP